MSVESYDYDRELKIYLKNEIEPIKIIKIFIDNGWIMGDKINYIFIEDEYGSYSYFSDDFITISFKNNQDKYFQKIEELFEKYNSIGIHMVNNSENIQCGTLFLNLLKSDRHTKYFIGGEDVPLDEYNGIIYDFTKINNIIKFGVPPMEPNLLNPPYGKTGYWEKYEGYVVPTLIEAGIEVEKVEFEHEMDGVYHYHKLRNYNKLNSGEWEVKDELHVENFRMIEIDGLKIKSIEDFLGEIVINIKMKYDIDIFKYKDISKYKNTIEKLQDFLGRSREYMKRLDHIIWSNLRYSKKELGNDFYKIIKVLETNGVLLEYREENEELILLNQIYFEQPIRKIGKKEEYEKEMEEEIKGNSLEFYKHREITSNLLKFYDYDISLYSINDEFDFKIKINNEFKDFKFYNATDSEKVKEVLEIIDIDIAVVINSFGKHYKEFISLFIEKENYEQYLDDIIILKDLRTYTVKELKESLKI